MDICLPVQCDDGTMPDDNITKKHWDLILEATEKIDRPGNSAKLYKTQLTKIGFEGVTETVFRWPFNSWPKDKKHKELGKP